MGDRRGACRVLVGRPDVKRPLARPSRRWEDNIKMDFVPWTVHSLIMRKITTKCTDCFFD
jgi:hypothetical protein